MSVFHETSGTVQPNPRRCSCADGATTSTFPVRALPCARARVQPLRPGSALLQRRLFTLGQKLCPTGCCQALPEQSQRPPCTCPAPGPMGSPPPSCADVLPPDEATAQQPGVNQSCQCHFCGRSVSAFVRLGFLGYRFRSPSNRTLRSADLHDHYP